VCFWVVFRKRLVFLAVFFFSFCKVSASRESGFQYHLSLICLTMFVGTHRGTSDLHKVCTHVPAPYSLTSRVRTLAEEVAVACRVQRILEAVILFPVRIRHSQGFSGILSESWLFAVLSQIVFALSFFLTLFVFLLKRVSKPSRDPGYQYQWSLPSFGVVCFHFLSEFRDTHTLYKVSPRVHALCLCSARVLFE
jgi:hypothetical protein